ncbi:MAG: MFS transporter [bacterium]
MRNSRLNIASVIIIAYGHGITDLFANFTAALLPVFESRFDLSKTSIGIMISVIGLSGSMFQLLYGYLGDKWGRRLFLVPGPAIAAIFMSLVGLSPSFTFLLLMLLIGGMGVSAFHPHAASAAGDMAGTKRDIGLAIFMAVGTVGYAIGPLVAVFLISSPNIGPSRMPLASIVGVITSILLYKYAIPEEKQKRFSNSNTNMLESIKPQIPLLIILCLIVILRSTTNIVFVNFMSLLIKQRGMSLIIGGWVLFLFSLSTALGTFLGGYTSNMVSRKKVMIITMMISAPLLLALVYTRGITFIIFLVLSGLMLSFSNPANVAIAQELIPQGASTASSLMMGVSWGIAAILAMFFGIIADLFGGNVAPAMGFSAILPVLSSILVFILPSD